MYQKEIIYMGLYKDGGRMGSAGFLKVENRERESRLYLKVQNIPLSISGRFPIRVYNGSGWKEINGITVQDGGGVWEENLAGTVNRATLQVMLPGGYLLEGKSRAATEEGVELQGERELREDRTPQNRLEQQGDAEQQSRTEQRRDTEQQDRAQPRKDAEPQNRAEPQADREPQKRAEPQADRELQNRAEPREDRVPADTASPALIVMEEQLRYTMEDAYALSENMPIPPLKEDKWEQILDTYEKIHPYGDERVYVKLEPRDFVILRSDYQHLVNNSFLLHGFYNYRYVILGKEEGYYLGVPGVFYEREKMVALMFGFEAFECTGGNVRAGEFGYYLRKVEL